MPTPIEFEAIRVSIDFDRDTVFRTSPQNGFKIDIIAGAPEQLSARRVAQDRGQG